MRHLGILFNVRAQTQRRLYSSWISVADSVPKTYAMQAKKLARSLEEKFNIAEDGRVINVRNGVKAEVTAEELMSFCVTKKKTKLAPSNLMEIVEDMKAIHVIPQHAHSKKVYEEAKQATETLKQEQSVAKSGKIKEKSLEAKETSPDQTLVKSVKTIEKSPVAKEINASARVQVMENLNITSKENENHRRLVFEKVNIEDLQDLNERNLSQSKESDQIVPAQKENNKSESSLIIERLHQATKENEESNKELNINVKDIEAPVVPVANNIRSESVVETKEKERPTSGSEKDIESKLGFGKTNEDPEIPRPKQQQSTENLKPISSVGNLPSERTSLISTENISKVETVKDPESKSSDRIQVSLADMKVPVVVGILITLGVYFFKTKGKQQPSAEETRHLLLEKTETLEVEDDVVKPMQSVSEMIELKESQESQELQTLKEEPLAEVADAGAVSEADHQVVGEKDVIKND